MKHQKLPNPATTPFYKKPKLSFHGKSHVSHVLDPHKQPTGDTAKVFSPSYSGGLEIVNLTDPTDDEGPEYRIQMAKNGAFVAMTRSLVDARMIQAMPEILACLKENIDTFNPVLEGTEWGMRVKRAHEVIAKAEGQK